MATSSFQDSDCDEVVLLVKECVICHKQIIYTTTGITCLDPVCIQKMGKVFLFWKKVMNKLRGWGILMRDPLDPPKSCEMPADPPESK